MEWYSIQGEVAILLFAPCEGNWYMLRVGGWAGEKNAQMAPTNSLCDRKKEIVE